MYKPVPSLKQTFRYPRFTSIFHAWTSFRHDDANPTCTTCLETRRCCVRAVRSSFNREVIDPRDDGGTPATARKSACAHVEEFPRRGVTKWAAETIRPPACKGATSAVTAARDVIGDVRDDAYKKRKEKETSAINRLLLRPRCRFHELESVCLAFSFCPPPGSLAFQSIIGEGDAVRAMLSFPCLGIRDKNED